MAIYIEYDGKNIPGNVTAKGFEQHIKATSLNFGVGRGISMESGHVANREATRPSLSEITFTKMTDSSSSELFRESLVGDTGKTVKIKLVQTGAKEVVVYMTITLEQCLVSGYSISADAEGDPVESVTLSFAKISINYQDFASTHSKTSKQHIYGYDLIEAVPWA